MNIRAAASAACGGMLAICSFVAAFFLFFLISPGFGMLGSDTLGTGAYLAKFGLASIVAAVGGAFPARFLGASWIHSLLASSVAVGVFFFGLHGVFEDPGFPKWLTATAVLGAALVAMAGSVNRRLPLRGMFLIVLVAVALSLVAVAFQQAALSEPSGTTPWGSVTAIALAWVSLPLLAGAFSPSAEQEGERTR